MWEIRSAMRLALFALTLAALLCAVPGAAPAQVPDYGALFGGGGGEAAPPDPPDPPAAAQQSRPAPEFDPASVPPASAYARVAADYESPVFDAAMEMVDRFRSRAVAILLAAPGVPGEIATTLEAASPTGRPAYFLGIAAFTLLLLAVGQAVNRLFVAYVARPLFVSQTRADPQGYLEKLPVLAYRMGLTVVGVALTVSVAGALGLVYHDGHEATLLTALAIFLVYGAVVVIDTLWRMVLCPFLPQYRVPAIGEQDARRLYRWLTIVSGLAVAALGATLWLRLIGVQRAPHVLISAGLALGIVLVLLLVIRTNGRAICDILKGGRDRAELSWLTRAALGLWRPLAVVYLLAALGKLIFDLVMGVPTGVEQLVLPYLVLVGGLVVYAVASYTIERLFARQRLITARNAAARADVRAETDARFAEEAAREEFGGSEAPEDGGGDEDGAGSAIRSLAGSGPRPAPVGRGMKTFEDLARRVASLLAIAAAGWILVYAWGGMAIFGESTLFGIAEDVVDILLVGYVAFHAVRIWIDQKIADEVGDEEPAAIAEGEGGGAGATRLATLLPLVRNFILTIMAIAIALVVASELGLNVAPLFAGAGIVGLAIGFGSQTLVRDILSGAFFLMDDAFRKGEYIDVGDVKGTVEKISLRSFQLRHHLGMLHTIPFGELKFLTNFSRDWVMMKLPIRVTYDTDVEKVRKLIKKLGQDLLEDPVIGDKFLQPLKSQGVIQMEDSAMILRVKFMCRPGEQWVIRKRVYQELRELFDREGIKFAHREVTVRIPDLDRDRPLSPEQAEAVGGAARTAVEIAEEEDQAPPMRAAGDTR